VFVALIAFKESQLMQKNLWSNLTSLHFAGAGMVD
jgi:hypothetical protein